MSDLVKINIKVDPSVQDLLPPTLIQELVTEYSNEYTDLAQKAYQSKVPYFTGELRGQIKRSLDSISEAGAQSRVFVVDELHTSSWEKGKLASQVAEELNVGPYRRRKNSLAASSVFGSIGRGAPTANWEGEAFDAFLGVI